MRGMDEEPQRASLRGDRFLAHRGLIAVCCGTAMAEAGLLVLFAPAARGLAPQVTALPPLAIFHDLRWLYSTQRSWLWFALLLAGLVTARSALNTVLVRLAWPVHLTKPPLAALRGALVVTTLACLMMSPLVSLTFGVAILPFSWPFLALLPAMLLIALPLSHAGAAGTWWRTLPPASAAWWLFAEFAVLTLAAAVAGALPAPDAVPVAGLAGLVNAWAWHGLTVAVARSSGPKPAGRQLAGQEPIGTEAARRELAGPEPADLELPGPTPTMVAAAVPAGPAALAAHRIPAGPMALAVVIATIIALTRLIFVLSGPIPVGHSAPAVAWVAGTGRAIPGARDSRFRLLVLRPEPGARASTPGHRSAAVLLPRHQQPRPAAALRVEGGQRVSAGARRPDRRTGPATAQADG